MRSAPEQVQYEQQVVLHQQLHQEKRDGDWEHPLHRGTIYHAGAGLKRFRLKSSHLLGTRRPSGSRSDLEISRLDVNALLNHVTMIDPLALDAGEITSVICD